ncbi:hypothetical protein TTHERM_000377399 (macronuclear) [Tetrahymena thermophila SB210]|uniref:Uncharacterized protein n=1 Tax=Tetrahymena thermophila (strain SB210) TaxID=312017 RepID=W7X541_TETTS|nr:hypothetical protein TTHERM_000377399 [Tetrahymena thermophila SB210]EWS74480.1 hypothetical protein TTHERM_000377399 [Tetrahymena thermophila SB210]|eukprot:XP_012652965.1 hypothetical protein TTHERM_000377399 [Tetrahymena thermophila SB210]
MQRQLKDNLVAYPQIYSNNQDTIIEQLQIAVEEVENQVFDLGNPNLIFQVLEKMHKEFIFKNEAFIKKYHKKSQQLNQVKKEIEFKAPENSIEEQKIQNPTDESGDANTFEGDRQSQNSISLSQIAQKNIKKKKEWDGNFSYAQLNEIYIPIPNFVKDTIIEQLQIAVEEVENQVFDLGKTNLINQVFEKMHKEFVKKNEAFINKYHKKPQQLNQVKKEIEFKSPENSIEEQKNQNPMSSGDANTFEGDRQSQNSISLSLSQINQSLIQKYQIYNKNQLNSYENDLKRFLVQSINCSQQNCLKIQQDIQQQIKLKEEKQQAKIQKTIIKNPYLYSDDDYKLNEEYLNQIIQTVNNFGVDRCQVQEKINSVLQTETMTINFKENKLLKTITYSILYRSICLQELEIAKKFIYKILGYINPKSKGFEQQNFLLRQIFLHFLCILIKDANYQQQTTQFLNTIFSFEFISSLILDHLQYQAQKILKKSNNPNNDDIQEQIDCLAKGYNLTLFLIDGKNKGKKYNHRGKSSCSFDIIFIYFEQSLYQQPNQAILFVINPNDKLKIQYSKYNQQ